MNSISWPPKYTIRRSQRARHLRLLIRPDSSIEIVLPPFAAKAEGLFFLEQKRDWVLQKLNQVYEVENEKRCRIENFPPKKIQLAAIGQLWKVDYQDVGKVKKIYLMESSEQQLFLRGNTHSISSVLDSLKRWLLAQAKNHLSLKLKKLANQHRFKFMNVDFRFQKTLWGSCSKEARISLNTKLLFLPSDLVEYVMIHELCHLQHLNHSKRFWKCVASCMPNYEQYKLNLRKADQFIPEWVLQK